MSPADVAVLLTAAIEQIDTMRSTLYAAAQQVHNASGHVSQVLHGGQPGPLLTRLDTVRQLVAIAAQRGDGAKARINATIATASDLGKAGAGGASGAGGRTRVPPPQAPAPVWPPPESRQRITVFVEQARSTLPPDIDETTPGRTHGRWCDEHGTPGAPLVSGREDDGYRAAVTVLQQFANRRYPPASIWPIAEMKLAAHMSGALSDALIINNVTCGERPAQANWLATCAKLVPQCSPASDRTSSAPTVTKTYTEDSRDASSLVRWREADDRHIFDATQAAPSGRPLPGPASAAQLSIADAAPLPFDDLGEVPDNADARGTPRRRCPTVHRLPRRRTRLVQRGRGQRDRRALQPDARSR
jgi:hypothetical protein